MPKRKNLILVFFFLFILLLSQKSTWAGQIILDDSSRGEIVMCKGDTMKLSLESNPSTGYSWERISGTEPILTETAHSFKAKSGLIGTGGKEHWSFQAAGTGAVQLSFEYRRPWEKGVAPAKVFTVNIRIKPALPVTPAIDYKLLDQMITKMTLAEKVGQMFMPDFRKWDGADVTVVNEEIVKVIGDIHPGGVILFTENVVSTEQTVRLVDQLQKSAGDIPLLVTIDQEGGRVVRLQSGTNMPGNMALGATRSTEDTYKVGKAIGEELKSLGINVNLAPVLDVNVNPDNPVIGVRSFGAEPQLVADMGVAYIEGLHEAGVAATAKHFPGHGDTSVDSHLGLPSVPHDRERLKKVELLPFQQAMDHGVDMVMTAHVTFPAIDPDIAISKMDGTSIFVPATLSEKVLTGLIREEMGFNGVIITDALNMKAITDHFGPGETVVRAIKAGADIVLMPENLQTAYYAVLNAVVAGDIPESRIDLSVRRILELKLKRGIVRISGGKFVPDVNMAGLLDEKIRGATAAVGSAEHRFVEKAAAEKAVTLLKNDNQILPFALGEGKKVVIFAPWQDRLDLMAQSLDRIIAARSLQCVEVIGFVFENLTDLSEEQKMAVDAADYIVLGSYSFDVNSRTPGLHWLPDFCLSVVNYVDQVNKPLAVMAIRNPYDIMYMIGAKAYLAVYGAAEGPNIPAGIGAIFGEISPSGKLPVAVPDAGGEGNLYEAGYGLKY